MKAQDELHHYRKLAVQQSVNGVLLTLIALWAFFTGHYIFEWNLLVFSWFCVLLSREARKAGDRLAAQQATSQNSREES